MADRLGVDQATFRRIKRPGMSGRVYRKIL
jgi:hypothetical protein